MARARKKSVSFDAMVKFFMHNYKIPTTKDVERLEAKIDRLENRIRQLTNEMSQPDYFQQGREVIVRKQQEFEKANADLEACFQRWEELESVEF